MSRNGIAVASVSYDSQAVLRRFADAYHISYPMLSDEGSAVIRKFGILNTNVPPEIKFYGIPFPGQYLIAPDGVVRDKLFLAGYEERPTASEVLLRDYGVGRNSLTLKAQDVTATVSVSDTQSFSGHRLGVTLMLDISPGWHIYGEPLPPEYTATKVAFADDLVARQSFAFPAAVPLKFEALGQTLPVYQGRIKVVGDIVLKPKLSPGEHRLTGTLAFQECNDSLCKLPQTASFELPLRIDPLTPAAPKG